MEQALKQKILGILQSFEDNITELDTAIDDFKFNDLSVEIVKLFHEWQKTQPSSIKEGYKAAQPNNHSFLTPMPSHKPYFNPDGIHKQIERLQLINSLEHVTVILPK